MRKLFYLFILLMTIGNAKAQLIDVDSLIKPLNAPSLIFEEYLVQLAWVNTPENKRYTSNVNIAEQDIKIAKWDWANDLALTLNLNENNLNLSNQNTGGTFINEMGDTVIIDPNNAGLNSFPRYNFQLTLNLGRIVNQKRQVNKAKSVLTIEEAALDQRKIELRSEVLRRYNLYLQTIEIYKTRQQAEEDFQQLYTLIESRFKKGTSDFEEYSRASNSYQIARESTLNTKSELIRTKIDLEELIGVPFDLAEQYHRQALGME